MIGISLDFNDPTVAQYVGFGLHLVMGTITGNIYGQASTFWQWIAPYGYHHGIITGLIVGSNNGQYYLLQLQHLEYNLDSTLFSMRRQVNTFMRSLVISNRYTQSLLEVH